MNRMQESEMDDLSIEDELAQKLRDHDSIISLICESMQACLTKTLPDLSANTEITPAMLSFHLERDPASGSNSIIGIWRDQHGQKKGMFAFHADQSFYAEYDVIRPHPTRSNLMVESITAWGRADRVKTEAKLTEAIGFG